MEEPSRTRICSFINESKCKKLAKENGKRLSAEALDLLSRTVNEIIVEACRVHNGKSKKIDSTFLATVIAFKKV